MSEPCDNPDGPCACGAWHKSGVTGYEISGAIKVQKQLEADAARWRYVRDNLAQSLSPRMDNTYAWRFRSPPARGQDIDEAIDKLLGEEK